MLRVQPFVAAAFLAVALPFLLIFSSSEAAVMEVGKVQCFLGVNFTESFHDAHRTCFEQREKEHKDKDHKDHDKKGKEHKPLPHDVPIEDFEWDDKCQDYCVYKTAGILSDDDTLPDKKDTSTVLTKGKISDDHYKVITSGFNDCLDMSAEIGKRKGWDKCKIITHHQHCFMRKMHETINKIQIDC